MSETIRKSVKILTALKPQNEKMEWSATEISKELDMPVQTVHRLLSSLEESGVVFKNQETKKYRIGLNVLRLGLSIRNEFIIRKLAVPYMEKLSKEADLDVFISVPEGNEAVIIDCTYNLQAVNHSEVIGLRTSMNIGASQRVILAYMSRKAQQRILQSLHQKGMIEDLSVMRRDLRDIRSTGFDLSCGDFSNNLICIAAPIFSWQDEVAGSLTIIGPESKYRGDRVFELKEMVKQAAEEVSKELGWVKQTSHLLK